MTASKPSAVTPELSRHHHFQLMKPLLHSIAIAATITAALYDASLHAAQPSAPIPEALQSLVCSKRNHEGTPAIRIFTKNGLPAISINTAAPLTDAQWDAVAALHPKLFFFNDQGLTDKGMDRLVALDPVSVSLRITPITGAGAAKFGAMKHLTSLTSHHLHAPTPEAKEALANHPTLEDFRTAGHFCIEALGASHLKSVELAEKAATPARVEELAARSKIESLSLFGHNVITVDDACMASVAKIKTLKELKLAFTALTFEGGLKHLLALPDLRQLSLSMVDVSDADLQKFKAAMPKVQVKHTPMKPEYRKTWDEMIAKAKGSSGR
jgi:hypothetical protein